MANKVYLNKTVREKETFNKVVDKNFSTFIIEDTTVEDNDTVTELFRLYDKLYLEIPLEGPQSHEYLVEESSKLVSVNDTADEIQPLVDEINELRERLLDANTRIIELENNQATNNGQV